MDEITVEFNVGELRYFDVETRDGIFTQLVIPKFHHSHTVGKPNLPMMNRIIEIPVGANVKTEIVGYSEKIIKLSDLGITNKLMPFQPSLSKSQRPEDVPFEFDAATYSEDKFFSEPTASVDVLGIMRDKRLGLLKVAPVQYNPVKNEIKVLENLTVKITFENPDVFATEQLHRVYYSPDFARSMKNMIALETKDDPQSLVRFPQKYVIIMPNSFAETMAPFIAWKKQQGFEIILYTFDGTANNNDVKSFIHELYNNATEDDPAPTYVLFVGDTEQIPPFNGTTGGHVTDLPFVDVTGDNLPDIYGARFSARNVTELQPYVDKTLYYEKFEIEDPDYLNNITLIAGWDTGGHTSTHGYPTIRYGRDYYYNEAHGFTTNMYETTGSGQFESEIINDVNNGVAFINYTAHGGTTEWSDPEMSLSDVHGFTNDGKYTLAIGNACLTASMEVGECFGEAWLRKANGGGIGYIGGTNSTYWDEDVFWSTGYFDHVGDGVTPTFEETTMGAYDAGFITNDLVTQEALLYVGNFAVLTSGSSRSTYYWEVYQLFGDPSLMIYWGAPSEMNVSHMPVLLLGSSTFEITTDAPKALIGITKDGELVASAMTDDAGNAVVDFGAPLTVAGDYVLTITAQNKIPYIVTLPAIVPANVTLTPSSVAVSTQTNVIVAVSDTSNAPMEDVRVWISSPGYTVDTVTTNTNGEATLSVNAPFGPYVVVYGKRPADSYLLFKDTLEVTGASDFTSADLSVSTTYGLTDTLTVGLPATVEGTPSSATVYVAEGNSFVTENTNSLTYTPEATGTVTAYVVQDGYNFYTESFPVIKAKGTISGHVYDASGNPISGAVVRGYDGNNEEIFSVTTNYSGFYDVGAEIPLGEITIETLAFGYETNELLYFVSYPHNDVDITLSSAPSSYITGYVKNVDGEPLDATIKIYRFDTEELYKTLNATADNGGFFADSLVNFDFIVKVKSSGYKQLDTLISVTEDTEWDFTLELPSGILILANDTKGYYADKECTIPIKDLSGIKLSSNEIYDTLMAWGLTVTKEDAQTSDPSTWVNYSGLIFAQGAASGVMPTGLQNEIINYVNNGGVLLIEGGELGYSNRDEPLASEVLHVTGWGHDNSGNIVVKQQRHPIWRIPNSLPNVIQHSYSEWGDEDSMEPADSNEVIAVWSDYDNLSSVIAYDNKVVYFSFNFANIVDGDLKSGLLENALDYLDMFPPVDVENENGEIIPTAFELSQNYPNPFNPTSTIKFAIPKNARVNLSVYNVLGQKVAELVNSVQTAGYHTVQWNATDFASGVYIYRLKADATDGTSTFTASKKMILLK
jgi:hypothetical protein